VLSRQASRRVAKEHALHEPCDDDAAADHASYSHLMEFREILERRRMVRAYDPTPVPHDTLERIAGTVRRAPSAGFSQGQRLVVVTAAERRKAIAEASGEEF
jgi:hypothetical protein